VRESYHHNKGDLLHFLSLFFFFLQYCKRLENKYTKQAAFNASESKGKEKKSMRAHPVSKIKETSFVFLFYFSECRKRPGNRRTRKEAPDASRASRGARKDLAIAYLEGERESQRQGVRGRGRGRDKE